MLNTLTKKITHVKSRNLSGKKQILSFAIISMTFFSNENFAQGFYINIGSGYGLSFTKNKDFSAYDYTIAAIPTGTTYDYKTIKGTSSFGKGIEAGGSVGYMFNKYLGAEVGLNYLWGAKFTSKYFYYDLNGSNEFRRIMSGSMGRFIPAVLVTTENRKKINPYFKAGIVVGVNAQLMDSAHTTPSSHDYKQKFYGGSSLGFIVTSGINYKVSQNVAIFLEAELINQNWKPEKVSLNSDVKNGKDDFSDLSKEEKRTEIIDGNSPSANKILNNQIPFSSIGAKIGLKISFGRKLKPKKV